MQVTKTLQKYLDNKIRVVFKTDPEVGCGSIAPSGAVYTTCSGNTELSPAISTSHGEHCLEKHENGIEMAVLRVFHWDGKV